MGNDNVSFCEHASLAGVISRKQNKYTEQLLLNKSVPQVCEGYEEGYIRELHMMKDTLWCTPNASQAPIRSSRLRHRESFATNVF